MLKSILGGVLRRFARPSDPVPVADDAFPSAGNLYVFRTSPYFEFSSPETGRFAVFKILGTSDKLIAIAVLDGVWSEPPTEREARKASILRKHHLAHTGQLAVFGLNAEWWIPSDLSALSLLGYDRALREEKQLADQILGFGIGCSYSTLHAADYAAEGEWRWAHDRQAFSLEADRNNTQNEAARAAQEERYRNRLSKLTWSQLLAETPFERWSPSPPFPPEAFTNGARALIHDACRALSALGPKPRKAEVRAVLKRCVEWFNEADERAGGVIETEEREDICAALEELAFVSRQKSLVDEIDRWREW